MTGLPSEVANRSVLETQGAVYLGTDDGIYKSVDEGATFQLLAASPPSSGGSRRFRSVRALGTSGGAIFAATDVEPTSLFRSTDGGATFTELPNDALAVLEVHGFGGTPGALWTATMGGVLRSVDAGASWSVESRGLVATTIYGLAAGGGSAYAVAPGGRTDLFRTTDAGGAWEGVSLPRLLPVRGSSTPLPLVAARGSSAIALDAAGVGVSWTLDAGATWAHATNQPSLQLPVWGVAMTDDAVFASDCCGIRREAGLGGVWENPNTPPLTGFGFDAPVAAGHAVVFAHDFVYRSLDRGATWQAGSRAAQPFRRVAAARDGSLLAAILGGVVVKSDDLGVSWRALPGRVPTIYSSTIFLADSPAGLFAGSDLGLFVSRNGGATFALFDRGLSEVEIYTVAATDSVVFVGTRDRGVLTYPLQSRVRRLVPVVLDVSAGRAHYTTELSLTNRGTSRALVTYLYTASLGSGSGSATDTLSAGQQLVIPDAVAYLRGRGLAIPTGGEQAGTLLLTFEDVSDSGAVSVLARTTTPTSNPQPGGSTGLAYLSVNPDATPTPVLEVYGLRSTPSDRSNVAVYNMKDEPVTFSITAFSGDGSGVRAVVGVTETLPPYGWKQYNRILDGVGFSNGWVEIQRLSETGALGAYGVVNDNVTNDGSFIEATPPVALPLYANVPVLVESSTFVSELVLTNASDEPATLELRYVEALSPEAGPGGTASIDLPARTQRILPNAIGALRLLSVPVGPPGQGSYAGALRVSVSSGGSPGRLFAGARTASPSPTGGQFGLFTPAAFAGEEATSSGYIYGLQADAYNRANVAAANTASSPGGGSVTLQIDAFDGDAGGAVHAAGTLTLAPGQWGQISGILASAGVRNGWVRITRTSGTAPWIAYGVVNDGGAPGHRTGDGAYVPMER